jgi:hypothetical protein
MANTVQQEILLMTDSSLSKRNLCEKNSAEADRLYSNAERLEQACWNGMLEDFLPGLLVKVKDRKLFLWAIQNAKSFLHIDLCDQPGFLNRESSVDPYIFVNHLHYN